MIDGERVNDVPLAERGLAMVFQSYALYPHMTVRDNMGFGAAPRRRAQGRARPEGARGGAGTAAWRVSRPKPRAPSGGQRQRVAIGRAIVREPVFLLDEPLSNLDAALRVQMRIELARLHDALDATMIYVTHDQVEAMTLADKIVVLQGGIIEQAGSPPRAVPPSREPVRRGLHRLAQDELPGREGGRRDASGVTIELVNKDRIKIDVAPGQVAEGSCRARRASRAPPGHERRRRRQRRGAGRRAAGRRDLPLHPDHQRRDAGGPGGRRERDPGSRSHRGRDRRSGLPSLQAGRQRGPTGAAPPAADIKDPTAHAAAWRTRGVGCISRSTISKAGPPW